MANQVAVVAVAKNGYADTNTYNLVVVNILHLRPATAAEISSFPTAVTAVVAIDYTYFQPTKVTYLTATVQATLATSMG